jgi:hypothetical protein
MIYRDLPKQARQPAGKRYQGVFMRPIPFLSALAAAMLLPLTVTAGDVVFSIDTTAERRTISPLIYGYNTADSAFINAHRLTLTRSGGNRWTAFNWENNASNAGSDWYHQNDAYLCPDTPECDQAGEAVRRRVRSAFDAGTSTLVTVPIQAHVAADKRGDGDVNQTPDYLNVRFHDNRARKGSSFSLTPDTSDGYVYQDEFVNWLETNFPGAHTPGDPQIFYCLDNEPALWPFTHERIHAAATTYGEMADRSATFAMAIKAVAADAIVFGPVSYGWGGWDDLQGAPDAASRNFLNFYLDTFQALEAATGDRLLDVVDLHWYPEAQGGGIRIKGSETTPAVVEARLQSPRSLWDPSYTEDSWIAEWMTMGPIRLIPLIFEQIAAHYPDTELAITEYYYGAGHHISGGIAQADVLGIFGREGLFAAALWPLAENRDFINAAFDMYRNYDGHGGHFGDISIRASTNDIEHSSVYASLDRDRPHRLVIIAINKSAGPLTADIQIAAPQRFHRARVYRLTSAVPSPRQASDIITILPQNTFTYSMPAHSVSTMVLEGSCSGIVPVLMLLQ